MIASPPPTWDNRLQGSTDSPRERRTVKATEILHDRGQSLWLDNITRSMLDDGAIQRYIDSYSVTGLTSNPSIFDKAIGSGDYDEMVSTVFVGRGDAVDDVDFVPRGLRTGAPPTNEGFRKMRRRPGSPRISGSRLVGRRAHVAAEKAHKEPRWLDQQPRHRMSSWSSASLAIWPRR